MQMDFLTLNAMPIVSLVLALVGLGVFWVAGKRFDRKWGEFGPSEKK
jgi:hypothetical protein